MQFSFSDVSKTLRREVNSLKNILENIVDELYPVKPVGLQIIPASESEINEGSWKDKLNNTK